MVSRFARLAFGAGAASVLLGLGIKTIGELALGDRLAALDEQIIRAVASTRTGWLNGAAVDFTALGSGTLLVTATLLMFAILVSTGDIFGALHLAMAGAGAGMLTFFFKQFFARPRPGVVEHLVTVSRFNSYPSGHALGTAACYFSFALIARRHLPRHRTRALLIGFTVLTMLLVGTSRVYLGVHYASDVLAGMLMGAGWSLLLAGAFSMLERAKLRRSVASITSSPSDPSDASAATDQAERPSA